MTSDHWPMYALTIGSLILSYHCQPIGFYWIILLFYYIIISRLSLYHYLLKYQTLHWTYSRLLKTLSTSVAIGIGQYRSIDSSADQLFGDQHIYISSQLQDQTDWHARISTSFGPALELNRSPRPLCSSTQFAPIQFWHHQQSADFSLTPTYTPMPDLYYFINASLNIKHARYIPKLDQTYELLLGWPKFLPQAFRCPQCFYWLRSRSSS